MPTPTNKQEVQRFLGMKNYLAKYIDYFSDKNRVLRSFTYNDVPFSWDANDQKHDLSTTPTLAFYDVRKP